MSVLPRMLVLLLPVISSCAIPMNSMEMNFGRKKSIEVDIVYEPVGDIGIRPLIHASIGNQQGLWLLDTGSSHFVINDSVVGTNQFKKTGTTKVATAAGLISASTHMLSSMKIGELTLKQVPVLSMNLVKKYPKFGHRIMGVIGAGILSSGSLELDFPVRKIRFIKSISEIQNQVGKLRQNIPMIELSLVNDVVSSVVFDTGNVGALVLFPGGVLDQQLVAHHKGIVPGLKISGDESGKTLQTSLFEIRRVEFNGSKAHRVPVVSLVSEGKERVLAGWNASLGMLMLNQCRWLFSAGSLQGWCPGEFELPGGFGLTLKDDLGKIVIKDVLHGSPAKLAGILPDSIVETSAATAEEFWRDNAQKDQLEIRIRLKPGQPVKLFKLLRAHFLLISEAP